MAGPVRDVTLEGHPGGARAGNRVLLLTDSPLADSRERLEGRLMLTPNARAARAVRGAKADNQSLSGLAEERLSAAGLRAASEVAQLTSLRRAARDTAALAEGSTSMTALGSSVRELLRAGLFQDPGIAAELRSSENLASRTRALLLVAERYRELLAEVGLVDPAEALWRAAEIETERASVLVAGYPRVGLAELVFLDSIAADGSVFVLPAGFTASEASAEVLRGRGWSIEDSAANRQVAPPGAFSLASPSDTQVRSLRLPNQEDEVRYVLAEVKRLLGGGVSQEAVTVIARDEQAYGPLVAAVAQEFRVPVKLSYAVPLRSTRLGGLLAGMGTALNDGLPFEATARLLGHPLLRALDGPAWDRARATHPAGLAAWQAITPAAALLAWPEVATVEQYRASFQRVLEESGASARFSERETRAGDRLERALSEYGQHDTMPLSGFFSLVDELLVALTISIDPPHKPGVEFHSPLAVFGASYQHVFFLGAAEGLLPAPLANDPLLDYFERDLLRARGLPLEDAMEASERETLSFVAAARTAGSSLTMSYPELLENREQLPSPFFAVLGDEAPREPEARPAASDLERLLVSLRQNAGPARHAWEVETRRESDAPPDRFDGMIAVPVDVKAHSFSASQLATLGQCAFRWFAQRQLRLAEPEEAEEDVSPMLLGSIYHKTLELVTRHALEVVRLAATPGGQETPAGPGPFTSPGWDEAAAETFRRAAIEQLDAAFTAAQEVEGTPRAASWPLQRREHLQKLTRVISAEDFLLPQTEVVRLEGRFTGTWRGFPVTGYVDRVDDGPAGLVLTDYKTGKSAPLGAKNSRGEPKLDLQLPLYVQTAAPAWFGADHPVASARYFSINGAATLSESMIDEAELQLFVERAMAILESGDFPVDPDEEQKVCTYCDFDALCRRGPRLGRKRQRAERENAAAARDASGPDAGGVEQPASTSGGDAS